MNHDCDGRNILRLYVFFTLLMDDGGQMILSYSQSIQGFTRYEVVYMKIRNSRLGLRALPGFDAVLPPFALHGSGVSPGLYGSDPQAQSARSAAEHLVGVRDLSVPSCSAFNQASMASHERSQRASNLQALVFRFVI